MLFHLCIKYSGGKEKLWKDIRYHHNSPMVRNKHWMLMGGFNEILDGEEHSGFETTTTARTGMREFQDTVRQCSLTDLGSHGPLFTWFNKREEGLICKKQDRIRINDEWLHNHGNSYGVFETGGISDHLRCRIQLVTEEERTRKPFKFMNLIGNMPKFLPLVKTEWAGTEMLYHSNSA